MEFKGEVIKKLYAPGSKSERVAVMIQIEGRELLLQRKEGNPFFDDSLLQLVGKRIVAQGIRTNGTLIIENWVVIDKK